MRAGRWLAAVAAVFWVALLAPREAAAWWNGEWAFRKPITVDLATGGVPGFSGRAVALIRLHSGNFDFTKLKEDGSDLRFVAEDDKTLLTHHVERLDGLFELGLVWVDLPVLASDKPVNIFMYYGNENAPEVGDARASYDSNQTLVYHFAEDGPLPLDSTAAGNNAGISGALRTPALIGQGVTFSGETTVTIPGTPSLGLAAGGGFTWQAWVKIDTPRPAAVLFDKEGIVGGGGGRLRLGLDDATPFVELEGAPGQPSQRLVATAPLTPGSWQHLALTAGPQLTLHVNGRAAGSLAAPLPALAGNASLGGPLPALAAPAPGPAAPPATAGTVPAAPAPAAVAAAGVGFVGQLDELRLANVERTAAAVLLAATLEGAEQPGLVYGQDEEDAGFNLGEFQPIVNAVTTDGWVVIALCGILGVLSWYVMVTKTSSLGGSDKANQRVLELFRRDEAALEALAVPVPEGQRRDPKLAGQRRALARAPIFRLYEIGASTLAERQARAGDAPLKLNPQAVASIRARIEGLLVREQQRLNRLMVVLTIAIAGGPFLGLLGTVVGVMVTFGAIAASGQVNINAIAPGIAGALLATVAGLVVAIPALFGYNYLVGRIRDVTTDMHVFVDEYTTRLAERYA